MAAKGRRRSIPNRGGSGGSGWIPDLRRDCTGRKVGWQAAIRTRIFFYASSMIVLPRPERHANILCLAQWLRLFRLRHLRLLQGPLPPLRRNKARYLYWCQAQRQCRSPQLSRRQDIDGLVSPGRPLILEHVLSLVVLEDGELQRSGAMNLLRLNLL